MARRILGFAVLAAAVVAFLSCAAWATGTAGATW